MFYVARCDFFIDNNRYPYYCYIDIILLPQWCVLCLLWRALLIYIFSTVIINYLTKRLFCFIGISSYRDLQEERAAAAHHVGGIPIRKHARWSFIPVVLLLCKPTYSTGNCILSVSMCIRLILVHKRRLKIVFSTYCSRVRKHDAYIVL